MDIVYARGEVTVSEVCTALPDQRSYSTVRTLIRILEEKGHLRHRSDGHRFIYAPTRSRAAASRSALSRLLETFFNGSIADAVAAFVDSADGEIPADEVERIRAAIDRSRRR